MLLFFLLPRFDRGRSGAVVYLLDCGTGICLHQLLEHAPVGSWSQAQPNSGADPPPLDVWIESGRHVVVFAGGMTMLAAATLIAGVLAQQRLVAAARDFPEASALPHAVVAAHSRAMLQVQPFSVLCGEAESACAASCFSPCCACMAMCWYNENETMHGHVLVQQNSVEGVGCLPRNPVCKGRPAGLQAGMETIRPGDSA